MMLQFSPSEFNSYSDMFKTSPISETPTNYYKYQMSK